MLARKHLVARDLGDPPAGGTEDEDLAGAALEDMITEAPKQKMAKPVGST